MPEDELELLELLELLEPWDEDEPVLAVCDVEPKAREYVLADPIVPVAAIVAVTSPWRTVLVRY